jgi:Flp pilus assembly protein TadD
MKRFLASTAVAALCAVSGAQAGEDAPKPTTDVTTEIASAHALRQAGQYPQAASALAQIMMIAPDDVRVIGEYGKVMAQQNRGDDAVAFLKRATELDANDWTLWSALGVAYDESNDPKNAASAYQRALALKPGEPAVLNNYGMSRMLAGDMTGAQMMFAQARGTNDPKLTNNAAILAEIQTTRMPARSTVPAPVPVKVQSMAEAPRPAAPKPMVTASTPKPQQTATAPTATGAPRVLPLASNPTVVMQAVPKDPLAGPVKPRVMAHKAVAKPALPAPALRTAADTH